MIQGASSTGACFNKTFERSFVIRNHFPRGEEVPF